MDPEEGAVQAQRRPTGTAEGLRGHGPPTISYCKCCCGACKPCCCRNWRLKLSTLHFLRYKAYFRWPHYQYKLNSPEMLPVETDACASVTAAFLQVLSTLHTAEQLRTTSQKRNVLMVSTGAQTLCKALSGPTCDP